MKVPQLSFNYLCYVLLQCIDLDLDLDLDLLTVFLSFEISHFLCSDFRLRLSSSSLLAKSAFCVSVYIYVNM